MLPTPPESHALAYTWGLQLCQVSCELNKNRSCFFLGRRCSSVETGFSGQIALRAVSGTLASYGERAALVGKVEEWANCNRSWLPRVGFARQWRAHQQAETQGG